MSKQVEIEKDFTLLLAAFDRIKDKSESNNMADAKGQASYKVFSAIVEWRSILKNETLATETPAPEQATLKQVLPNYALRDDLRDWGCTYKREDKLHVWRDNTGAIIAKGVALAVVTRFAHETVTARRKELGLE